MNSKIMKTILIAGLLATILLLTACSKINQENYNQLKVGMTYEQVIALLGEAEECSSAMGLKNCRWGDTSKFINIRFAGQKVAFYSAEGLK